MRNLKISTLSIILISLIVFGQSCKTNVASTKVPYSIDEKTYFDWVGGKEGTRGTTIRITGFSQTLNLSFSKVYFQNHEYQVVPSFKGNDFVLSSTKSEFYNKDRVMSSNPKDEYGNQVPPKKEKIPFDLKEDEAVIVYAINGEDAYYKISGMKKLETVYRP